MHKILSKSSCKTTITYRDFRKSKQIRTDKNNHHTPPENKILDGRIDAETIMVSRPKCS